MIATLLQRCLGECEFPQTHWLWLDFYWESTPIDGNTPYHFNPENGIPACVAAIGWDHVYRARVIAHKNYIAFTCARCSAVNQRVISI